MAVEEDDFQQMAVLLFTVGKVGDLLKLVADHLDGIVEVALFAGR